MGFDYIDNNVDFEKKHTWKFWVILIIVIAFLGALVWISFDTEATAEQRQSINYNDAISGKYMASKICHVEKNSAQFVNENTIFEQIKFWETDKYGNETYELIDEETGAVVMVHFEDIVVLEGDLPEVTEANYYLADVPEEAEEEWRGDYDYAIARDDIYDGCWCPYCWNGKLVQYFEGYEGNSYARKFVCPSCDELFVKRSYHTHDWLSTSRYDYVDSTTVLHTLVCKICYLEEQEQLPATLVSGPDYVSFDLLYHRVYYKMIVNGNEVTASTKQLHTWKHVETDEYETDECIYCGGWRNTKNK